MTKEQMVYGVHPVLELLEVRGGEVERIFVAREGGAGLGRVLKRARAIGVPVSHLSRPLLARKVGARAVHQGIAAQVATFRYADVDEVCRRAAAKPDAMLVLADRVEDPRNLGAIVRTCAAAGVDGVILGSEGAVGQTPAVAKVAAGALERVPVAREPKPPRRLEMLREQGFRAFAMDPSGGESWDRLDLTGRIVIVAGGERKGPRPGVRRACDGTIAIPLAGGVESLNVAVALGVLLFEAVRQRRSPGSGP